MKKLLLIGLMLCCTVAFAQQTQSAKAKKALSTVNPALLKMKVPVSKNKNIDNGAPVNTNTSLRTGGPTIQGNANETTIGHSYYDLQTNNTISDRLVNYSDGTMSAVWTFSPDFTTGYPNRGTGYNYFDGSSWGAIPTTRIENKRAGFCNVGVTADGLEAVIAHGIQADGSNLGMLLTTRTPKGSGTWNTDQNILGEEPADTVDFWSKMAIGGSDGLSIHAIWRGGSQNNQVDGQAGPIFYSRSQNDGANWDILESIIPQIGSSYYLGFSADEYSIDARGSTVAIVASTLGADVVLLKSTDNGTTWTKTVVDSFPLPLFNGTTTSTDTNFDGVPDTLWSPTGDANVLIDNNGEVHVFFTIVRSVGDGTTYSYFPFTSELYYWNESFSPDSIMFIAYAPILNSDTVIDWPPSNSTNCPTDAFPWGAYGVASRAIEMPSAGVDGSNNIYVCYQTVDELSDPGTVTADDNKFFKHPYIIKSTDGGYSWTDYNAAYDALLATQPLNGELLEGVFACMAKNVDSQIHLIYQRDAYPGESLAAAGTCDLSLNPTSNQNDIIYVGIDPDSVQAVGIPQLPANPRGLMLSANFPNPASTYTRFNVTLTTASNVKIDVVDVLGQNLYSENRGELGAGVHTVTLNTAYLSSGIYFYTVTAGNERVTGKMIVQK